MIDKNQMMREGKEDWTILDQALFSIDDANGNQIFLFFSDSYRGEKNLIMMQLLLVVRCIHS
jgi:hypothetical protein